MSRALSEQVPEFLLLVAVVFGPLLFGAVEPWSLAIVEVMVFGAFAWSVRRVSLNSACPPHRALLAALAVVILIGVLQRLNPRSILEPSSWAPMTVNPTTTQRALRLWAMYVAALCCVFHSFDEIASIRRLVVSVFGVGCAVAVIGIIQTAQGDVQTIYGWRLAPFPLEPFGPYYNRDHAASMMVMGLLCGMGLVWDQVLLLRARRGRPDRARFAAIQSLILGGIAVMAFGILLTRSLGALCSLLMVLGAGGFFALKKKIRRGLGLLVLFLLIPWVVSKTPIAHKVRDASTVSLAQKLTISHVQYELSERMLFDQGVFQIISDFPWFGVGLGAFQQAYYPYQSPRVKGILDHAHCDWLELCAETGLIGLTVYIFGLFYFLRSCARTLSFSSRRAHQGLAWGIGGAVLAFLLHGLGDFSFQIPANALIFFLLLAGLGVLPAMADSSHESPLPTGRGKWRSALALAALILAVTTLPSALASVYQLTEHEMEAARLDHLPNYYEILARQEFRTAPNDSAAALGPLRQALLHAETARRLDPGNPWLRALEGQILRHLGRSADADGLAGPCELRDVQI